MSQPPHVGTLREKPLHAALKRWYAEPGDGIEVAVDGFVVDLVRNGLLIEIQTRGFASLKRKLTQLLERHSVRIVHPVAETRWIVRLGEEGEVLSRRRSPRRGSYCDVFSELVSFPELLAHDGLSIELVLVHDEELRRHVPGKAWRRRGWVVVERRLVEVVEKLTVSQPADLLDLLPSLPSVFTTSELSGLVDRPRRIAQQTAYCLRKLGLIEQVDKRGNAIVYAPVVV